MSPGAVLTPSSMLRVAAVAAVMRAVAGGEATVFSCDTYLIVELYIARGLRR